MGCHCLLRFRYDLNQIPYDYTVEVRNRFKGLDLIDRVETVRDFILGASKSLQMVTAAMKLKDAYSLEGKL